jgi:predicted acyl esterase
MTTIPKSRTAALVLLATLALLPAAAQQSEFKGTFREEMMPARDGTKLGTNVFVPAGKGPWPAVLQRTPYGKDGRSKEAVPGSNRLQAAQYEARGYALVVQDCRGTGRSAGENIPFRSDQYDGYDTVEWIARQEWSNGKVAMVGASALGITSTLAATFNPPHLVCAFVIVTPADIRRDTLYMGGVYRKEMNDGWLRGQGKADQIADTISKTIADPYWDWRDIVSQHPKITIPMYNVGGWYDIFAQGNIDNFTGLQQSGGGRAAGNQKLLMAPIGHGLLMGKLKYPANSAWNQFEVQARWLDYWMKGELNGIMDEPAVRYYTMGDTFDPSAPGNRWRTADSWPPPAKTTAYFLGPKGSLGNETPAEPESAEEYGYDPKNPVPTIGGQNLMIPGKGPMDQRAIAPREDYLRFETAPLAQPVEVTGRVYADLWVETDAPDTDFMAKLVDVYPDGYEALVLDAPLRLRYRQGLDREVPCKPGEVMRVRIDLWSTSLVFNRGHKIAVHVTSSNDPRFDPNPNTGKKLRADGETRVARNRVHHDRAHPSRVLLPIVRVSEPEPRASTRQ